MVPALVILRLAFFAGRGPLQLAGGSGAASKLHRSLRQAQGGSSHRSGWQELEWGQV